jgi:hypothetical protein
MVGLGLLDPAEKYIDATGLDTDEIFLPLREAHPLIEVIRSLYIS